MSELIQSVKDGVVQQTKKASESSTSSKTNQTLGKDAFLKLLVTQMQYQDPLNPSTDTEYVAQLASFSQLEKLENLSNAATNSQAFGLIGSYVIIKTGSDSGSSSDSQYVSGTVDFVSMSGGKAQLSVNGKLYSIDLLDSVIDDTYILKKGLPGVSDKISLNYDTAEPKDVSFDVSLGSGDTTADKVAVMIDDTVLDSSNVTLTGNKVTISKSALSKLSVGDHKVTIGFNDTYQTTVKNMITLKVTDSKAS